MKLPRTPGPGPQAFNDVIHERVGLPLGVNDPKDFDSTERIGTVSEIAEVISNLGPVNRYDVHDGLDFLSVGLPAATLADQISFVKRSCCDG